jgi:hypothetical protein
MMTWKYNQALESKTFVTAIAMNVRVLAYSWLFSNEEYMWKYWLIVNISQFKQTFPEVVQRYLAVQIIPVVMKPKGSCPFSQKLKAGH